MYLFFDLTNEELKVSVSLSLRGSGIGVEAGAHWWALEGGGICLNFIYCYCRR